MQIWDTVFGVLLKLKSGKRAGGSHVFDLKKIKRLSLKASEK